MQSAYKCLKCGRKNRSGVETCSECGAVLVLTAENRDSLVGALVDKRFVVHEQIGAGGMGTVYRATQTTVNREVALKVLSRHIMTTGDLEERFRNEASLASRLNHPGTVTIFDFGIMDKGDLYIAMELVGGVSLDLELADNTNIHWRRALKIAIQICASLQNAHDNNIIHRDLKPDNVMLTTQNGEKDFVKVLDFGIAKLWDTEGLEQRKSMTEGNQIFGTPEYMSPEQICGDPVDPRTDVYSLGIILYKMLTGRAPFVDKTPIAVLTQQLMVPPPPFKRQKRKLRLPEGLETLVMSCLAKKSVERPATMKKLSGELEALLSKRATLDTVEDKKKAKVARAPTLRQERQKRPSPRKNVAQGIRDNQAKHLLNSRESTLERFHEEISKNNDFPTTAENKNRILTCLDESGSSVSALSGIILQDLALTTKLLKLANTGSYGKVRGKGKGDIATVREAVLLLGFEAVKKAVLEIETGDSPRWSTGPNKAYLIQDIALRANLAGTIASKLEDRRDRIRVEEAFLCAMFRPLGRYIAAQYFYEDVVRIDALVYRSPSSEREIVYNLLGISYDKLGQTAAERWNYPKQIVGAMKPLLTSRLTKPSHRPGWLHHLSVFSNEAVRIWLDIDESEFKWAIRKLVNNFQASLSINDAQITILLENVMKDI